MCYNPGKTNRALALAHYYKVPVLSVDDVVTEALYYSGTPAAVAGRLLCTEAALRAADSSPANDSNADKPGSTHRPGSTYRPARALLTTHSLALLTISPYVTYVGSVQYVTGSQLSVLQSIILKLIQKYKRYDMIHNNDHHCHKHF